MPGCAESGCYAGTHATSCDSITCSRHDPQIKATLSSDQETMHFFRENVNTTENVIVSKMYKPESRFLIRHAYLYAKASIRRAGNSPATSWRLNAMDASSSNMYWSCNPGCLRKSVMSENGFCHFQAREPRLKVGYFRDWLSRFLDFSYGLYEKSRNGRTDRNQYKLIGVLKDPESASWFLRRSLRGYPIR